MKSIPLFFRDARNFQIAYLFIFLGYGIAFLGWSDYQEVYFQAIFTALLVQAFLSLWKLGTVKGLKSAVITGLGLCLLLRTNDAWAMSLASAAGIGAKFFFRVRGKHLFNPSNFGIIIMLLLSNCVWVSPGQWGNSIVLLFLIAATGFIILWKVGRLDITFLFFATLFILEYARTVLYLGWGMDVLWHKFTSGSLLLFAFFMITDPKTTPDRRSSRYLWTMVLAVMTFVLSQWFYLYTASIWALFLITPLTVGLDMFFPAEKYKWLRPDPSISNAWHPPRSVRLRSDRASNQSLI